MRPKRRLKRELCQQVLREAPGQRNFTRRWILPPDPLCNQPWVIMGLISAVRTEYPVVHGLATAALMVSMLLRPLLKRKHHELAMLSGIDTQRTMSTRPNRKSQVSTATPSLPQGAHTKSNCLE